MMVRTKPTTLFAFVERRLRRLWPLLVTVALAVLPLMIWRGENAVREVLASTLFVANITVPAFDFPDLLIHTWTLGTEMQFYLLIATLVYFVPNRALLGLLIAAMFLAVTSVRIYLGFHGSWPVAFYSPVSHSSGLFLGALLAILSPRAIIRPDLLFALSAVCLAFALSSAGFTTRAALTFWITLTEVAAATMIASLLARPSVLTKPLRLSFVRYLGVLSYGIYLWHYPIAVVLREIVSAQFAFVFTLAVSILLSALTHHTIERRFRRQAKQAAG